MADKHIQFFTQLPKKIESARERTTDLLNKVDDNVGKILHTSSVLITSLTNKTEAYQANFKTIEKALLKTDARLKVLQESLADLSVPSFKEDTSLKK